MCPGRHRVIINGGEFVEYTAPIEVNGTIGETVTTVIKAKTVKTGLNDSAEAEYTYQMYLAEGETAEETYQATITSLENAVTQLEEELEEALEDGDEETAEELEAELQIAKNNQITQSIEAKQIYENAMTNYKYAQQLYEIDTNGLEDDLNDAKEILMEAEQNLSDFQEQIGDGIVYAEYSGTVTAVSYKAGDLLVNDSAVASFTDLEDVTMTVSVSQEDIA